MRVGVTIKTMTGARGYVITGDEQYLEPANRAVAVIFSHIDQLKTIFAGNPEQLSRIKELEKFIDEKVSNSLFQVQV